MEKLLRHVRRFLLLGGSVLVAAANNQQWIATATAEAPPKDISIVPLPDGVPELPQPEQTPIAISRTNSSDFRALFPTELAPLFRTGGVVIGAVQALKFIWRLDDTWEGLSRQAAQSNATLISQGELKPDLKLQSSFAFGSAFDIVPRESEPEAGAKILWNSQSAFWGQKAIEAPFELYWFKEAQIQRIVRGILLRAYPLLLGGTTAAPTQQLFREKIVLRSPEALSGLTVLTFRFLGMEEDVLWMYSPAIKLARQLTGSNRSDALFRSSISPDDFFVWSGKPELVEAKLDSTKIVFGAFANTDIAPLSIEENGCATVGQANDDPRTRSSLTNLSTALLSSSVFVPRRTWRVELYGKDPYSLYGRQVVYVDHESMLPLYKFVYDRSGHLWKSIIGVYGLAASHDRSIRRVYQSLMYIYDHRDNSVQILRFPRYTTCTTETEMLRSAQFDPHRLWPRDDAKAIEGETQTQTATPAPASSPKELPTTAPEIELDPDD